MILQISEIRRRIYKSAMQFKNPNFKTWNNTFPSVYAWISTRLVSYRFAELRRGEATVPIKKGENEKTEKIEEIEENEENEENEEMQSLNIGV